jgi:diketogulonate reductase-like aldo/keto reductase
MIPSATLNEFQNNLLYKDMGQDFPTDEKGKIVPDDSHYVESYQVSFPFYSDTKALLHYFQIINEVFEKFLEELVDAGLTRSIGLSNYNPQQMQDVLKACRIRPVCNQFEVNPFLPNNEWVDFCHKENIAVVAYAPFGAPDRSWAKTGEPLSTLENALVVELAKKYNKKPGQIVLRWLIQRGIIPIPKSVTPSRIEENIHVFDFELSPEDMNAFKEKIKENFRFYWFDV